MGIDIGKSVEAVIVTIAGVRNGTMPAPQNPNATYYLYPMPDASFLGVTGDFQCRFLFAQNGPFAGNWVMQCNFLGGMGDEAFLGYSAGNSEGTFLMTNFWVYAGLLWYAGYAVCVPRYTGDPEPELNNFLNTLGLPAPGRKLIELGGIENGLPTVRLAEKMTHTCCYIKFK